MARSSMQSLRNAPDQNRLERLQLQDLNFAQIGLCSSPCTAARNRSSTSSFALLGSNGGRWCKKVFFGGHSDPACQPTLASHFHLPTWHDLPPYCHRWSREPHCVSRCICWLRPRWSVGMRLTSPKRQLSQGGRRCSDVGTIWDRRERPDRRWIWRWAAAWVGGMAIAVALAWLALHEATNGLWPPIPPQSASVPRE